jgi:predicted MPP superfamily phosphohydrolase
MAHRPDAFNAAVELDIDLTLSGHTHGGQVGLGGRSFWSLFAPGSYLRGLYRKEKSRLYVSSGIGHWFPFRLGCPSEAPIIELIATTRQPEDKGS